MIQSKMACISEEDELSQLSFPSSSPCYSHHGHCHRPSPTGLAQHSSQTPGFSTPLRPCAVPQQGIHSRSCSRWHNFLLPRPHPVDSSHGQNRHKHRLAPFRAPPAGSRVTHGTSGSGQHWEQRHEVALVDRMEPRLGLVADRQRRAGVRRVTGAGCPRRPNRTRPRSTGSSGC